MTKLDRLLPIVFLFLAACSALPDIGPLPESPLLRTLERKSGLIAYIGVDGNVHTIDQGGGNQKAVTSDAKVSESEGALRFYQFPTWSWDNEQIAFIAIDRSQNASPAASLYIGDPGGKEVIELFGSSDELPFYLYWIPKDGRISFLTSSVTTDNLILRMASVKGGESQILDVGRPYYWSWSPDGQNMIVHVGDPADSDPNAHLAFLLLSDGVQERRLGLTPHQFQAPAWSPKGEQLLLAAQTSSGKGVLYLTDTQGSPIRELTTFTGRIAFGWSPNGEYVAYISTESNDPEAPGKLRVAPADELSEALASSPEEGVLAFFWSPDNQKVAYLQPLAEGGGQGETQQGEGVILVLNILEISTGKTRTVATFQPTQQFLALLPAFDQYQHSTTLWSPDSENLVLAALTQDGGSGIWVVPASGRLPPRFVTPGIIGFWSWK